MVSVQTRGLYRVTVRQSPARDRAWGAVVWAVQDVGSEGCLRNLERPCGKNISRMGKPSSAHNWGRDERWRVHSGRSRNSGTP